MCDNYCPFKFNYKDEKSFICQHICHDLAIEFSLIHDLIDENIYLKNEVHFLSMLYLSYDKTYTFNDSVKECKEIKYIENDIAIYNKPISILQTDGYCSKFYFIIFVLQFIWSISIIIL